MEPERLPLAKVFDVPFLSLDGTSVEMASLLFLFLLVMGITGVRRHRQRIRHAVQALSILVFFYVVYSCLGVFGMIRNGLYGLTLLGSVYSESFYWLALPVVVLGATLLSGPIFCGWICPTGTLQEAAGALRRFPILRRARPTRGLLAALGVVLVLFLALLIALSQSKELFLEDSSLHWAASLLLICYLLLIGVIEDRPSRALRGVSIAAIGVTAVSHLVITSPVHFAFTSRSDPSSALATLVVMLAALFVPRAWCRYLCPFGYVMGLLGRFSRLRVVRTRDACPPNCQVCTTGCEVAAIERGVVEPSLCQLCHACVDSCPQGGLEVVDVWQPSPARPQVAPVPGDREAA